MDRTVARSDGGGGHRGTAVGSIRLTVRSTSAMFHFTTDERIPLEPRRNDLTYQPHRYISHDGSLV